MMFKVAKTRTNERKGADLYGSGNGWLFPSKSSFLVVGTHVNLTPRWNHYGHPRQQMTPSVQPKSLTCGTPSDQKRTVDFRGSGQWFLTKKMVVRDFEKMPHQRVMQGFRKLATLEKKDPTITIVMGGLFFFLYHPLLCNTSWKSINLLFASGLLNWFLMSSQVTDLFLTRVDSRQAMAKEWCTHQAGVVDEQNVGREGSYFK